MRQAKVFAVVRQEDKGKQSVGVLTAWTAGDPSCSLTRGRRVKGRGRGGGGGHEAMQRSICVKKKAGWMVDVGGGTEGAEGTATDGRMKIMREKRTRREEKIIIS